MTASKPKTSPPGDPVLEALALSFPAIRDCLPLAISIHKTILARMPQLKPKDLRAALRTHTLSTRYLKALSQAQTRFDLDAQPEQAVSDEHRQQALDLLRQRFRKKAERSKLALLQAQQQEKLKQLVEKFNAR